MIQSRFLLWGGVIASDHQTDFADFNADILFRSNTTYNTQYGQWKLHTKYSKRVEKNKKQVRQGFLTNNLFAALEKLVKWARQRGTWTDKMYKKY